MNKCQGRDMDNSALPIGIFDSGAGGISFLRVAAQALPQESFIYFGDSGNAPYGSRPLHEIRSLSLAGANRIYGMGVKVLVVACNTASSAAVADIRAALPIPIVAMEPALKPALNMMTEGNVIVMATPATLKQEMFQKMITDTGNEGRVVKAPCSELVGLVEAGDTGSEKVRETVKNVLLPYRDQNTDVIVLGCTHFILVSKTISQCASEILHGQRAIIDGNAGTVTQLKRVLQKENLLTPGTGAGKVELFTSSEKGNMLELYRRYFTKGE